jgi:predicted nucleic acid-binding protein
VILVDTSVWINHLRAADERLAALLAEHEVLGHPFVAGEVALGHLRQRDVIMRSLQRLPQAAVASDREVLRFIENERLYGRGVGYIDAHLLAAVQLTPEAKLWTRDRPLQRVAAELGVAAMLPH